MTADKKLITAASQEQSSGVSQINAAMSQMSKITQQNASASEELAATAEEMSSQAEQLRSLMATLVQTHAGTRPQPAARSFARQRTAGNVEEAALSQF